MNHLAGVWLPMPCHGQSCLFSPPSFFFGGGLLDCLCLPACLPLSSPQLAAVSHAGRLRPNLFGLWFIKVFSLAVRPRVTPQHNTKFFVSHHCETTTPVASPCSAPACPASPRLVPSATLSSSDVGRRTSNLESRISNLELLPRTHARPPTEPPLPSSSTPGAYCPSVYLIPHFLREPASILESRASFV